MEEDGVLTATEPGAVATDPELSTMLETEALEQADPLSASGQTKELVFTQYCPQKVLPSPAAERAPLVCRKRYEARFASLGWAHPFGGGALWFCGDRYATASCTQMR